MPPASSYAPSAHPLRPEIRLRLTQYIALLVNIILCGVLGIIATTPEPRKEPEPYHTSILSGEGWVMELLAGHPERIRNELGMNADLFKALVELLQRAKHTNSRFVSLEEQLAIFLYTVVTGLPARHVGERFQRSNETISRYFRKMVIVFSTSPIYPFLVKPPGYDPLSQKIRRNRKLWPYFKDAIGAIDGSHIPIAPPTHAASAYRNRKGFLSHNCLFASDFDLCFTYALTGWEGSAADAWIFGDACSRNLEIPEGKYVLGDLGFPSKATVLVPYRGVRYHLAEWGRANLQPNNERELFNLRHASARNVIERSFGVLKKRFRILLLALPYSLDIQARIPAALCAIHNFIVLHNPTDEATPDNDLMDINGSDNAVGDQPEVPEEGLSQEEGSSLRDSIASAMWRDYVNIQHVRGLSANDHDNDHNDDDNSDIM